MKAIGVVTSYSDLHAILRQRAEALNVSRLTIDDIAGLQSGYAAKLLQPRPKNQLGPMSLGAVLGALA